MYRHLLWWAKYSKALIKHIPEYEIEEIIEKIGQM